MAVEQEENARVVVARPGEASHAYITVVAVVNHVETANAPQHISQGPIAVFLDFVGGNYRHRGRGIGGFLKKLGSAINRVHLELGKVFKAQTTQVGLSCFLRLRERNTGRSRKQKPEGTPEYFAFAASTTEASQEHPSALPGNEGDSRLMIHPANHSLVSRAHTGVATPKALRARQGPKEVPWHSFPVEESIT